MAGNKLKYCNNTRRLLLLLICKSVLGNGQIAMDFFLSLFLFLSDCVRRSAKGKGKRERERERFNNDNDNDETCKSLCHILLSLSLSRPLQRSQNNAK